MCWIAFIGKAPIHFVDPSGHSHRLCGIDGVPAPLHLAAREWRLRALNLHERLALGRAMLAMAKLGDAGREKLADVSFGQWLAQHEQPDSLIDKFYELILVSALNERCRDASAAYAIQVFQQGMLAHSSAYRMGTPACPLGELYQSLPCRDVRLGVRMNSIRFDGRRAAGMESGGEVSPADAVILAVNYPALGKWIPPELLQIDSRFGGLDRLQSVPILGAHLWFDRPVISHTARGPDGRTAAMAVRQAQQRRPRRPWRDQRRARLGPATQRRMPGGIHAANPRHDDGRPRAPS